MYIIILVARRSKTLTGGAIMKGQSILVLAMLVFTATGTAWADLSNGLIAYYPFSGNTNDQ